MKKHGLFSMISLSVITASFAQVTTIVNYDFNSGSSYPLAATATASGIGCSASGTESFQVYTGVATGTVAFANNSVAGNALAMANSGGNNTRYFVFQLSGTELPNYKDFKLYWQSQRSSTGATLITLAYSTDGTMYTNVANTFSVGTTFSDMQADLSSVSAINNKAAVYFKLMVSGAGATTGTIRIDNFQVQANKSAGTSGNPWSVTGNDVTFPGNLEVGGDVTFRNKLTVANLMFDPANGIRFMPASSGVSGSFRLGTATNYLEMSAVPLSSGGTIFGIGNTKDPNTFSPCLTALSNGNLITNRLVITGSTNALDIYNSGVDASINLGTDLGFSTAPGTPARKIMIANFCKNDVEICKEPSQSSFLSTGPNVEIGSPVRSASVTLNIRQLATQTDAIKVTNAAGQTNFLVKGNGYVYAREINVMPPNIAFPDYVFSREYRLMPLSELEVYLTKNKHLPNIPSASEVEARGINVAELQVGQMEKIEELFLYLIELKKENEALKKRIERLEK